MKFLVVGGGSMGKRRIRCLLANKVPASDVRLVDTRQDRRADVQEKYGVEGYGSTDDGLAWGPDAFLICVPPALHMQMLLAAAREGKHAFCEVPLALDLSGVAELVALIERHRLVIAPGSQVPLHPAWKQVKRWVDEPSFGKPLVYHQIWGQYLPDWHPYEDYRKFYAVQEQMGGGNIDIFAHELTALYWLLPSRVRSLFYKTQLLSSLEIQGSDCQQLLAWTGDGMAITLQFDLIQRRFVNQIRIVSEQGTIECTPDYAKRFLTGFADWEVYVPPEDFQYEQCYIDEIKLFIDAVHGRIHWHIPLPTAIEIVQFLTALRTSQANQSIVEVSRDVP